jgi:hypothetical protein
MLTARASAFRCRGFAGADGRDARRGTDITGAAILLLGIPARSSPALARRPSSTHARGGVAMLLTVFASGTPTAQAAADELRPDCTSSTTTTLSASTRTEGVDSLFLHHGPTAATRARASRNIGATSKPREQVPPLACALHAPRLGPATKPRFSFSRDPARARPLTWLLNYMRLLGAPAPCSHARPHAGCCCSPVWPRRLACTPAAAAAAPAHVPALACSHAFMEMAASSTKAAAAGPMRRTRWR